MMSRISHQGHDFANRAADKAKGGIEKVASTLTDTVDSARQQSKPIVDQVGAAATQVRDAAAEASDSLITYTRNNPVKALLIAAMGWPCCPCITFARHDEVAMKYR